MKAVGETVLHVAVVGPVFVMALLLDTAATAIAAASAVAGRFAGEPRSPGAGIGDLRAA